jgi:hypothetical protein
MPVICFWAGITAARPEIPAWPWHQDPATACTATSHRRAHGGSQRSGYTPENRTVHPCYTALQSMQHLVMEMTDPSPRFGFVAFAETWNGRLAMLGFVIGLG